MQFILTIQTDNAAFEEPNGTEIARILRKLASELEEDHAGEDYQKRLLDINGNVVGEAKTE